MQVQEFNKIDRSLIKAKIDVKISAGSFMQVKSHGHRLLHKQSIEYCIGKESKNERQEVPYAIRFLGTGQRQD